MLTIRRFFRHVAVGLVALFVGCSHSAPYVGGDAVDLGQEVVAAESVRGRLILVGDAGIPDPEVMKLVTSWAGESADRALVAYLGDNIHPEGLPARGQPGHDDAIARLDGQLAPMLETGCRGLFIPGNHDWGVRGDEGLERLRRQSEYIESILGPESFAPDPGCAGPETVRAWGFRLVAIDTEWWIREGRRPTEGLDCPTSLANAEAELRSVLESNYTGDITFVLAHHPLTTHGPHGGFYDWKDHIFPLRTLHRALWLPLPGIGSLYPLARSKLVNSDQDMGGRGNQRMRERLAKVMEGARPFVYASGHDHSLQVMVGKPWAAFTVVSGSGSQQKKVTPVGHDADSWFAQSVRGFVVFDRLLDGALLMRVVTVDSERPDGAVAGWWIR